MDSKENISESKSTDQTFHLLSDPNKRVPKYCTSVLLNRMKNGHVILTFVENDEAMKTEAGDQGVIIDRIMVDDEHARRIIEALTRVMSKKEE